MNTDRPTTPNENCTHLADHYHGMYTTYKTCGCRCQDCLKAQNRYNADYRARRDRHPLGEHLEPRSPEWLAVMRRGLFQAVVDSYERKTA